MAHQPITAINVKLEGSKIQDPTDHPITTPSPHHILESPKQLTVRNNSKVPSLQTKFYRISVAVMVVKASINGPNRRRNRAGDKTLASDFNVPEKASAEEKQDTNTDTSHSSDSTSTIQFKLWSF